MNPNRVIARYLFVDLRTEGDADGRFSWTRQLVERVLSGIVLALLSPLMVIIGASIWCETGLPILFLHRRVGRNGQPFRLLKFRTMVHDSNGPSLTVSGDRRISRVGRVLRHFKLDEIPQFWNVARGEMAIVGPRPEVPEFVDLNAPIWQSVLRALPGITDPASIAYRQEEKLLAKAVDPIRYYTETLLPAKLAMNLAYLKERSMWSDCKVVLKTVECVAHPNRAAIGDASSAPSKGTK